MSGFLSWIVKTEDGKAVAGRICDANPSRASSGRSVILRPSTPLTLFTFPEMPASGLLFSDCGGRFFVDGNSSAGSALCARVEHRENSSLVDLVHWFDHAQRLIAEPELVLEAPARGDRLRFGRMARNAVPPFSLSARHISSIPGDVVAAADGVAALIRLPMHWKSGFHYVYKM